ncbi:MAG: hypothetical protein IJ320_06630 [Phascolarctobacterium sp.]|nr:hypothetical protein [Phascolarctobacterium sp.]
MREFTTTGLICLCDEYGIEYVVSKISYTVWEDESYKYVFTPNYSVIDLLKAPLYQGIPGLKMELRKKEYVRENMVPVFISERSPNKNREDLWELLSEVGLDYHNQLEWLIRTTTRYSGDRFYVRRFTEADEKHCVVIDEPSYEERALGYCKLVLGVICAGHDVQTENYLIDDSNRKEFYHLLMTLYRSEYEAARKQELENKKFTPRGRQRIKLDVLKADEVFCLFTNDKISEAEALQRLEVSRATFYRRLKEYKNLA